MSEFRAFCESPVVTGTVDRSDGSGKTEVGLAFRGRMRILYFLSYNNGPRPGGPLKIVARYFIKASEARALAELILQAAEEYEREIS